MKAISFFQIAFLVLLVLTFTGCSDDDSSSGNVDMTAPVITITSPEGGADFHHGHGVHVQATITDNDELHEYKMEVFVLKSRELKFEMSGHEHGQSITLDTTLNIVSASHHLGDHTLIITTNDHAGNSTVDSVQFHVHPM